MGNKLTDNETKKALECCTTRDGCKSCPRSYNGEMCRGDTPTEMIRDALDLINRLEAENSNLTSNLTSLQNDLTSAKAEVERLKENLEEAHVDIREHLTEIERMREISEALDIEHEAIKNCAVKEFAERVKEKIRDVAKIDFQSGYYYLIGEPFIDNILKEMVGE